MGGIGRKANNKEGEHGVGLEPGIEAVIKEEIKNGKPTFTISKRTDGSSGTRGTWLPYSSEHTTHAWAFNGEPADAWIGTGPFSGCKFAVFHQKGTSNVGIAHIPMPALADSKTEWEEFKKGVSVLNEFKVPLADPAKQSASYIFVVLQAEPNEILKVDVQTNSRGGGNGPIFAVTKM